MDASHPLMLGVGGESPPAQARRAESPRRARACSSGRCSTARRAGCPIRPCRLPGCIADEFQCFPTAEQVHGEQSFLDVCRSFGAFAVLACQSIASLRYALCDLERDPDKRNSAIDIICNNTATKMFFRSTDEETALRVRTVSPRMAGGRSVIDIRPLFLPSRRGSATRRFPMAASNGCRSRSMGRERRRVEATPRSGPHHRARSRGARARRPDLEVVARVQRPLTFERSPEGLGANEHAASRAPRGSGVGAHEGLSPHGLDCGHARQRASPERIRVPLRSRRTGADARAGAWRPFFSSAPSRSRQYRFSTRRALFSKAP